MSEPTRDGGEGRLPRKLAVDAAIRDFDRSKHVRDIFLSYSSADETVAARITRMLTEEFHLSVWDFLDRTAERREGAQIDDFLQQGVQGAGTIVFLVSRAWLYSGWCQTEFLAGTPHDLEVPPYVRLAYMLGGTSREMLESCLGAKASRLENVHVVDLDIGCDDEVLRSICTRISELAAQASPLRDEWYQERYGKPVPQAPNPRPLPRQRPAGRGDAYVVHRESRSEVLVSLNMRAPGAESASREICGQLSKPNAEGRWRLSRSEFDTLFVPIVRKHCEQ